MRKSKKYYPRTDQKNPDDLKTSEVQIWHHGIMMGVCPLEEAKQWIREKRAFVITDQAIGTMKDGISTV